MVSPELRLDNLASDPDPDDAEKFAGYT